MAKVITFIVFASMLAPVFSQSLSVNAPGGDPDDSKRLAAEATYELIVGYIAKEDYPKVQKEVRNLLDLQLPSKFDSQLGGAFRRITLKLLAIRQFAVAHTIVDMAIKELEGRDELQAELLLTKATIFKAEGKEDSAIEFFNKSRQITGQGGKHSKDAESKSGSKK
ncbi:MAG: hypothetical protein HYR55_18215 [Acidobacteria bacterium]|nr:hypothetical protein [Acidobacteriota bacterium]MBI3657388.1 hypothetical protein [Acidobacteriota bacterium]